MPKIEFELRPLKNEDEEIVINNLIEKFKLDIEKRGIKIFTYNNVKYRGKKI